MPPKSAQKAKDNRPTTPEPSTPVKAGKTPNKTPRKTPASKVKTTSADFKPLDQDAQSPSSPVNVSFDGSATAEMQQGKFTRLLRLASQDTFTVTKTLMITEGQHAGSQAILIRPAKPFEFLKLDAEVRNRIYGYYLASRTIVGGAIVLDGKRTSTKEIYSKSFSEGLKNRVGLLAVNKEINKEATPILYNFALMIDSTSALVDWVSQCDANIKQLVTNLEIKTYQKTSARNALGQLAQFPNLKRLHFELGVSSDADPSKAARLFLTEAHRFLPDLGKQNGDKTAAVDLLSFGSSAFTFKDKAGTQKPWPTEKVEEFKNSLKAKLTVNDLRAWVCICGSTVYGHSCDGEFKKSKKEREKEAASWEHIGHGGAAMLNAL